MKNVAFFICLVYSTFTHAQYAKYVNPFIGTGGTGHTFPGATTPFAMVQLSPDTRIDGSWEGCSGYHYSDSIIYGFSHTHLSGTGCSDYGDIAFMPYFSKTDVFEKLKTTDIHAKFSHKNEKASAGYYSVVLDDIPVKVELTATTRTGFQRYTFNEDGFGYVILNLKHRDELLEGTITSINKSNYKGKRVSKAWATRQELYYYFQTNKTPSKTEIVKDKENDYMLIMQYPVSKGETILLKTGISATDEEGARLNLLQENIAWDFEQIKKQAFDCWEKELSKIEVQDAKQPNKTNKLIDQLTTFYTAMYHCMIHPSIMNDVDGRYKGRDGKIHKAEGFNYYTVFSLWDTHRALHPLLNIIDKKRSHDFVITFLKQFEQSGRLPMWELWNNETDCMIGFHSVSVILDAYRKQVISKAELQQLWPAVKAEAMSNRFGLDKFREKGYLSVEDESESVSKTLEYSYDMWCVSEIARELNMVEDEKYFSAYQNAWQELHNPETGFIQPRKNGNWLANFNPYEVNNNYTEANAWQYSFYHPHHSNYNETMLDSLFKTSSKTDGRTQADITGLIGQYAHGNEPSHNFIYLLENENRVKYLKKVYDNFYTNKPDGLIGNEDCGQMSAWYVMSALGFYQTCPGDNTFKVGEPLFKSIKLLYDDSKYLAILKSIKPNSTNEYGIIMNKSDKFKLINFSYESMQNQKQVIFTNDKSIPTFYPPKIVSDNKNNRQREIFAPLIKSSSIKPFTDKCLIEINKLTPSEGTIYYSIYTPNVGSTPNNPYDKPFFISNTCVIEATVYDLSNNIESNYSIAHFYKRPHNYSIQLNCQYNKQYTADGDDGIIDGQFGDKDWRKGGWQGYQAQDFEAVIDMQQIKSFDEISANFLQDTRSWILMPTKVEFYTSDDNVNFKLIASEENKIPADDYTIQTQQFSPFMVDRKLEPTPLTEKTEGKYKARYIKIKAYNFGKLPSWHMGKDGDAFIFIDEIEVK